MRALILLAEGFEETEAFCPFDVWVRAGLEVDTVSITDAVSVRSSHGLLVNPSVSLSKVLERDYDVVFCPGGMPGAKNLAKSEIVHKLLLMQNDKKRLVAAICASPAAVLGPLGLLIGHQATCFPGSAGLYPEFSFCSDEVVADGNLITGKSAGCAFDLGLKVLEVLLGKETKEKIKHSIYYKEA